MTAPDLTPAERAELVGHLMVERFGDPRTLRRELAFTPAAPDLTATERAGLLAVLVAARRRVLERMPSSS